jgi:hypothetical protein
VVGGIDKQHIPGDSGIFVARIRRDDLMEIMNTGDRIISVSFIYLGHTAISFYFFR